MRSREKLPGPPKAEEVRSGKVEGNLETESEVGFYKVRQEIFLVQCFSQSMDDRKRVSNPIAGFSSRSAGYIQFQDVLAESKAGSF